MTRSVLRLIRFDDTDHTHFDQAPHMRGLAHQDQNVHGGAVTPSVEGMKPKSSGNIIRFR
jgi:hypothetical protein